MTVDSIENRCQCGFVRDRITNEAFQCSDSALVAVIYGATIHGTATTNSSELLLHIEQWAGDRIRVTILHEMLNISYRDITGEVCYTGMTAAKGMISSLPNEIQDRDKDDTMSAIIGVSSASETGCFPLAEIRLSASEGLLSASRENATTCGGC